MRSATDDRRAEDLVAVFGGAGMLAGSWAVAAKAKRVPAVEARVFHVLNDLPDPAWPVVWAPMQLGSFGGSLATTAVAGLVSRDARLTIATLVAGQSAYWGARVVKKFVQRGRPAATLPNVHLRERATGLGYLSGHSAVAFAAAAVLGPSIPRGWRKSVLLAAPVVAFGRIHGGAHLPLDVVGGIGLGVMVGTLARRTLGPRGRPGQAVPSRVTTATTRSSSTEPASRPK